MEILFVTEYYPHEKITGGVEARAYYLSKHLARDHDVKVICSRQEGQPRESEVNGCEVHRVGGVHPYSGRGSFLSRISFANAALDRGRELDFDLVDGQSFLVYPAAHGIAEDAGKAKVATYHETWIGEWIRNKGLITGLGGELWERMSLSLDWDRLISVSEFTRGKLLDRGVEPGLVEVVPNGVELSEFEEVEAERGERPTVCTVSRLTEKKRIDFVMRAFERVSEEVPDAQLKVVGKGPESDRLEELARELDADIELLGYLPDKEDVIEELKGSHLFVSASVLEGFGMSLVEAAASGTPFVVSDIDPHVEVSKGEKGGLIFERDDMDDLAKKILKLLQDSELYERKEEECTEIAERYAWGSIAEELEKIYRNLV